MEQHQVRLDIGGRSISVYSAGAGGQCVVILAGGGMPAAFSAPLQARIAEFGRVLSYDRAGLGESDPPPHPLTFEEQAQDLAALLAASGESGPFVLVGESFGGLVARTFARLFAREVAGLVLVDSAEEAHAFGRLDLLLSSGRQQFAVVQVLRPIGMLGPLMARALPRSFDTAQRRRIAKIVGRRAHWTAAMQEANAYTATPEAQRVARHSFPTRRSSDLSSRTESPSAGRMRRSSMAGARRSSGWPPSRMARASSSPNVAATR